ncbi:MAG TPA: hypothetical protein VLX68_07445 [Chitinivibrionales bacterium]|nr:hypothetical protein [Chitinivibrionales bacterium]
MLKIYLDEIQEIINEDMPSVIFVFVVDTPRFYHAFLGIFLTNLKFNELQGNFSFEVSPPQVLTI